MPLHVGPERLSRTTGGHRPYPMTESDAFWPASPDPPTAQVPRSTPDAKPMHPDELRGLLARAVVARVSWCGLRGPRIVPLWFLWDGDQFWLETAPGAAIVSSLRTDPRLAIEIGESQGGLGVRSVTASGDGKVVDDSATVARVVEAMFRKYLGADSTADPAVRRLIAAPHVAISVPPSRVIARDDIASGTAPHEPHG